MDPRRPRWENGREVDSTNESLFGTQAEETPAALAAALAPPAAAGHYDELRGGVSNPLPEAQGTVVGAHALPARPWARFFENLGREGFADLNRRTTDLQRQVRDNGITYNVYADAGGPQRPWALDLFPLIIPAASWQKIEAGVLQRVQLLERILDDVYGPQKLLAATYRALLESLLAMCPAGEGEPRIVLLTPGPYNETYFEHAYLARYLGIALVEGSDLTVRGSPSPAGHMASRLSSSAR